MIISFGDAYQNNISDKKFHAICNFLRSQELPDENKSLDKFLNKLQKEIIRKFKIKKIDFPYYHYFPNSLYKKEEILIDISINDNFDWQKNLKKISKLSIPEDLKEIYLKYQKLSTGYDISFNNGYYSTKNKKAEKIEKKLIILADQYFELLKNIILNSNNWQYKSDSAAILNYAIKNEKEAIKVLISALNESDHAVHNIAARSLFPKIYINKADVWCLKDLFSHHNPYCQNKFLGTIANVNLTLKDKEKLNNIKTEIEGRTKYKQGIVSYAANALFKKI